GDFWLALTALAQANKILGDGRCRFHALLGGFGAELEHGLSDGEYVVGVSNGHAEVDGNRIRELLGPFPEELFALEAKDAAPEALEVDRNDGGVTAFENFHEAGLKGLNLAGAGEAAFGKDADEVALLEGFAGRAESGDDHFGLERVDGNRAEHLGHAFDPGARFDIGRPGNHTDGP